MRAAVALAVIAALGLASTARAAQPPNPDGNGTDYFVTIAARTCDRYVDITANKARNNIQESLRDLGPDTNYTAGQLVNPLQEQEGQANCRPLSGWRFTLGGAIAGAKVLGPWGSLSVVSGPYATDVTTLDSVPDRDSRGVIRTDGSTIAGATTIELTSEERAKSLVLQGGTATDPVLNVPHPSMFAFGALRCSDDNVNGDNVEYVRYSGSLRHIYCFAYYVVPPPTSGTIVVTKHVSDPPRANQTFTFAGNISYTANHEFPLTVKDGADASTAFYRAATGVSDEPWTVAEVVPPGWRLDDLQCTSSKGSAITRNGTGVAIRLVATDIVHCTFTDSLVPPPGRLVLTKLTFGGVGTFPFAVSGGSGVLSTSATTTEPGEPAASRDSPIALDPGTYSVSETLPQASGGHWVQTAAGCKAQRGHPRGQVLRVEISSNAGQVCQFENRFIPDGSITIFKTTEGDVGSTNFIVSSVDDPARQYTQTATTTADGKPALARGDSTRALPLGRYVIEENGTISDPSHAWILAAVSCGGRLVPFQVGQVVVELTAHDPDRVCRFTNVFALTPPHPQPAPTPSPMPIPLPLPAPAPDPALVLSKRALTRAVRVGEIATYAVTVRNTGSGPAYDVAIADRPGRRGQLVSAEPSQGSCDELTPTLCTLGTLNAGEHATIRVRVRATAPPAMANVAVVGSGGHEFRLVDNIATASVRVRAGRERGACAAGGPVAHAAC